MSSPCKDFAVPFYELTGDQELDRRNLRANWMEIERAIRNCFGGDIGAGPSFIDSPGYVIGTQNSDSIRIFQRIGGSVTELYSITSLPHPPSHAQGTAWGPGQRTAWATQRNDVGASSDPILFIINSSDPNPANWTHTTRALPELASTTVNPNLCIHNSPVTGQWLAIGSSNGSGATQSLLVFDTTNMTPLFFAPPLQGENINSVRFNAHENMFAVAYGNEVAVYSLPGWTRIFHLTGLATGGSVAWAPDSSRLAVSVNGLIEFYDPADWTAKESIVVQHSGADRRADIGYSMDGAWFGMINFTSTNSFRKRLFALPDLSTPVDDGSGSVNSSHAFLIDFMPLPDVSHMTWTRGGNPGTGVRGVIGSPLPTGTNVQFTLGNFWDSGRTSPL